jgi:polyketide biosynthesis enoyl-CoA hydratase PksI
VTDGIVRLSDLGDGIELLELDDPRGNNGLSDELCALFEAKLAEAEERPELKVLVLRGRKEIFSSGATLESLRKIAKGETHVRDVELVHRLAHFPLPVIAAIEGAAIGGGLMLAMYCDLAIAAREHRYGLNFVNLGFTPGMGATALIPRLAGERLGAEMLLTGKLYRGSELASSGLFNEVCPSAEVFDRAIDRARRMAEKPKRVLELLKTTLAAPRLRALEEALVREHELHRICFSDPDLLRRIEESYQGGDGSSP